MSSQAPEAALTALKDGNLRFLANEHRRPDAAGWSEIHARNAEGQAPFAAILGCADSRVGPEILFDQLLGDLFVVREAGNVGVSASTVGSLEYAVAALGVRLVVVLGHTQCGAVGAAFDDADVPGQIRAVLDSIRPGISGTASPRHAVLANARAGVANLRAHSEILSDDALTIIPAIADVANGGVEFLD